MSRERNKAERVLRGFEAYCETESARGGYDPAETERGLFRLYGEMRRRVPAYRKFLEAEGALAGQIQSIEQFERLPITTKRNYHQAFSLPELCWDGRLDSCDMLAVSSGSTGEPTVWPRFVTHEWGTARRFEQVLVGAFEAHRRTTLAVVCFALGSWVGGMYTTAGCRHLAAKGYPITVVTPGNNPAEILRIVKAIGHHFDQVVLLGYPPFIKDVVDAGARQGVEWPRYRVSIVLAGEVFSENWRELVCRRLGSDEPALRSASLYGTADGGVLANETPASIRIRRAMAERPELGRELFGEPRLPTLCQYDPAHRYFEVVEGQLLFSGDGGAPLLRYNILDRGGVIAHHEMRDFLVKYSLGQLMDESAPKLPFVYVFGRTNFAVSYYGANVYPENVAVGLEQPEFAELLTGKFVLEVAEDTALDAQLRITVELGAEVAPTPELAARLGASIVRHLLLENSEFCNYVPAHARDPQVALLPLGEPNYFPKGVKHRYTRH